MEVIIEPASSKVATTGFPNPAVVAVDAPRATIVDPCTIPAAPAPAMIAKAHFINGLISVMTDAVMMIPATIEDGVANMSNKWPTKGT